jgi:hypothetical protein
MSAAMATFGVSTREAGFPTVRWDLPFISLCIAFLTITFNGIQPFPGVSLTDVPLVAASAFMLAALLISQGYREIIIPRWHFVAAYLLLVSGILATLAISQGASADLLTTARFVVTLFGVPLLISLTARTERRRTILFDFWIASVLINCGVAILGQAGVHIGESLTGLSYSFSHRQAGLTEHPTHLGYVCVLALPVVIVRLILTKRFSLRCFHVATVVIIIVGLILAGSRVALVGAILSVICIPLYTLGRTRQITAVVMGGIILVGVLVLISTASVSSLGELPGRSGSSIETSDNAHIESAKEALTLFSSHPLTGAGYSNVRQAQDIYLQLLEGGGVLAVAAFGIFIGGCLQMALAIRRSNVLKDRERALAGALAMGIVTWMIMGIFQPPIYDRYLYVGPGLIMAMYMSVRTSLRGMRGQASLSTEMSS